MNKEITIIHLHDTNFSPLLREITDPPQQLYARGNSALLHATHLLAVVGSRQASSYGQQCIERLLPTIIKAGVVIVSGLAYGIDSLAHQASVDLKAPTIAVLGTGIDDASIYPRPNLKLAHNILENNGLLVSEYAPGTAPAKHHFPKRNRIIVGLSQVTLIMQAAEKSGSLISARLASEYNRDVAAVPGPITDPLSAGPNTLIKDGATPVSTSQDILDIFGLAEIEPEKTRLSMQIVR